MPPEPTALQTFFWTPRMGVGAVLLLAIGGPVVASGIAVLTKPRSPWWQNWWEAWWENLAEIIGGGWFAPLMMFVLVGLLQGWQEFRARRAERFLAQSTSLMVGLAASRARYYASVDAPDPWDLAVYDLGNYLNQRVPPDTLNTWRVEAYRWYATHPAAADLPKPIVPANIPSFLRSRR